MRPEPIALLRNRRGLLERWKEGQPALPPCSRSFPMRLLQNSVRSARDRDPNRAHRAQLQRATKSTRLFRGTRLCRVQAVSVLRGTETRTALIERSYNALPNPRGCSVARGSVACRLFPSRAGRGRPGSRANSRRAHRARLQPNRSRCSRRRFALGAPTTSSDGGCFSVRLCGSLW